MSIQKPVQRRLGRGLSSLLSVSETTSTSEVEQPITSARTVDAPTTTSEPAGPPSTTANRQPFMIRISEIAPNPHQPRRQFNETSIAELAASMKAAGLIQPIVVRQTEAGFQLIAGERRLRAAKLAGLAELPAVVREVDAYTQAQMALIENIQREDLNPVDRAESYRSLMTQLGLTQAELAGRLGEDRSSIANYLRVLDLSDAVRQALRDGAISLGHAKILASISDHNEQERLCDLILRQELSVRNLERLTQSGTMPDTAKKTAAANSAHLQEIERSVTRQIGLRTQIRTQAKKGKGRLVIHYSNLDQFDELIKRLGVKLED